MKKNQMEGNTRINIQDTRAQILRLLKIEGSKTVSELCQDLGLSSMGVRQHLLHLEHEGFIERQAVKSGIGRPSYIYSLAEAGNELFPRSYAQLAIYLLDSIQALNDQEGVDKILAKTSEKTEMQYRVRMAGKDLEAQVSELADIRTDEGYMTEWARKNEDTFILSEHNCAIFQVAASCNQLCVHEQKLFQKVLDGVEVRRESHIISGDKKCTFIIQRKQ